MTIYHIFYMDSHTPNKSLFEYLLVVPTHQTNEVCVQIAYLAQIPKEISLFHAHVRNPGRRANDENRAASTRTICNQLPKLCVERKLLNIIHAHGGSDQRNVVDHRRSQPDSAGDQLDTRNVIVQIEG